MNNMNITLTPEQERVFKCTPNTIVEGVAGSGKTMLAILLAEKLLKEGYTVATIVFTKALAKFISNKSKYSNDFLNSLITYEYDWRTATFKHYDYIIIDEFQDFSLETLKQISRFATNGVYFFGDLDQSIYYFDLTNNEPTIKRNQYKELNIKSTCTLTKNFRIQKNVVNLVVDFYLKMSNVESIYFDNIYKVKKLSVNNTLVDSLPIFKKFENHDEEIQYIASLINNDYKDKSIGILLNYNDENSSEYKNVFEIFINLPCEDVPSIYNLQKMLSVHTERKIGYKMNNSDHLDFNSESSVNILTIHSSKGLEFDVVILPFSNFKQKIVHHNSLFVAMTRCKEKLVVTYSVSVNSDFIKIDSNNIEGEIFVAKEANDFYNAND